MTEKVPIEAEWMVPGAPCFYEPSTFTRPYAGVISEPPRLLGRETWIVRLEQMEPAYAEKHHNVSKRTVVFAAAIERVTRRTP